MTAAAMTRTILCAFLLCVADAQGPCDLYDAAGTPCVAAHSLVRALYAKYNGSLYQVERASDGKLQDIGVGSVGGFADAAIQDAFCSGTSCVVRRIFDQSPRRNHLGIAPPGGAVKHGDKPVNASSLKLWVGGHPVYGAYFDGGKGYRIDNTSGVARGDDPQSIYMVTGGKTYNSGCCFDYGNAEIDNNDDGQGTMEAVYFGSWNATRSGWCGGVGDGPWIMADLENGLWACDAQGTNPTNVPMAADFVTAMLKGNSGNQWALKGGDATKGSLTKLFEGARPAGYHPMKKQGAIILGIGGDNSNSAVGTFYEGAITSGYSMDSVDVQIQANIVAAGYGKASIDVVV